MSLPQEQFKAQNDHEVKLQTAWRPRTNQYYECLRWTSGSRGRRGARNESIDAGLSGARL